jgi:hypothetical protein
MKNIIDASPRLRGEKVFLKPIRDLGRVITSPALATDQGGHAAWDVMELELVCS